MAEFRPAIIRMFENGISMHEIARLLDIPRTTIRRDIERYQELGNTMDHSGRGRKRASRTPEKDKRLKECLKETHTAKQILRGSWLRN